MLITHQWFEIILYFVRLFSIYIDAYSPSFIWLELTMQDLCKAEIVLMDRTWDSRDNRW